MRSDTKMRLGLDAKDWQTAILQYSFDATMAELRELHGADADPARQAALRAELRTVCRELAERTARRRSVPCVDRG